METHDKEQQWKEGDVDQLTCDRDKENKLNVLREEVNVLCFNLVLTY